jgi:hypothetical protein
MKEAGALEFYPSVFGHIEVRTDPRSPRKLRKRPIRGLR